MANKKCELTLVQVSATSTELFGLDKDGRVWVYKPRVKSSQITNVRERFAFWTQLTNKGAMWVPDKEKK